MTTQATGVRVEVPTPEAMHALGRALAATLRAGDLVLLTGDLGAGKTTLARGLGEGLGVRGPVTSPTFVIAREHPSLVGGPPLVHVDAYRLDGLDEVDGLDLDASLEEAVTVVEWGEGLVEGLSPDRLEVRLQRPTGEVQHLAYDEAAGQDGDPGPDDVSDQGNDVEPRAVVLRGVGARWQGVSLPTG